MEFGVAIVIVHHTRKGGSDGDAFEKVSGTLGLSGAADTTLILDRDGNGATLYGRGRDIPEIETAVEFDRDTCKWRVLGKAADVRRTDERTEILDVLKDADEPMTPTDIADALGVPRNNIKQMLFKMARAEEVRKAKSKGKYIHPDRTDLDNPITDNRPDGPATVESPVIDGKASTADNPDNPITGGQKSQRKQGASPRPSGYRPEEPITGDKGDDNA